MPTKVRSSSPEETFRTGEQIGRELQGREIILLSGELGAGKTLITKGIAAAVGIDTGEVVSPTFTIMNHYEGRFSLYHIDLYRFGDNLNHEDEAIPEIDDHIDEGVIVIEWAQFLPAIYFNLENSIKIEIRVVDENTRLIVVS